MLINCKNPKFITINTFLFIISNVIMNPFSFGFRICMVFLIIFFLLDFFNEQFTQSEVFQLILFNTFVCHYHHIFMYMSQYFIKYIYIYFFFFNIIYTADNIMYFFIFFLNYDVETINISSGSFDYFVK